MSINTVRLSGHQICDYCWVLNRALNSSEIAIVSDYKNEPQWSVDTALLNVYSETLLAGTLSSGASAPTAWKIYKQEVGSSTLVPAANLTDSATSLIDYNVQNKKQYIYYHFAETTSYITAPMVSEPITTDWKTWCLFDVDTTEIRNAYTLHSAFTFAYDLSGGQMPNNMQVATFNNFTPYPKIQVAPSNFYSGTLQSLMGITDPDTDEYSDGIELEAAIKAFTTSTRKKFLKDIYGHIWEVAITSYAVSVRENLIQMPCDVQIGWVECGSADGLILTN